jgi:hypothetical protein
VIGFGGVGWELDDGGRLLEDFTAAVKDKVIVRGHGCKGDGEWRTELSMVTIDVFKPLDALFRGGQSKDFPL